MKPLTPESDNCFGLSRERIARILSHQEADRISFDCVPDERVQALILSMNLPPVQQALYRQGDFRYVLFDQRAEREAFDPYLRDCPPEAEVSWWGVGMIPIRTADGSHAGHKTFHPLAEVDTVAGLERYPFPDFTTDWRHTGLEALGRSAQAQQYTVVGQMSQTILETAYLMRGIEQLMADFHERRDYVAALFEKIGERRRFQARRFAEAGVDVLRIGDDIATQESLLISPRLYRERIKPHHASVIAAARAVNPRIQVLYHSDGNLTDLLPDLIEIGVTAINPVQPECMNVEQIKRDFGRDLTLWGCCPVQSLYATGSAEDVRQHVRSLMENLAADGGLVVQFTNVVVTPKALENLGVFFDSFGEMATDRTHGAHTH
jgi:uroporphyrinogen decarboxylase